MNHQRRWMVIGVVGAATVSILVGGLVHAAVNPSTGKTKPNWLQPGLLKLVPRKQVGNASDFGVQKTMPSWADVYKEVPPVQYANTETYLVHMDTTSVWFDGAVPDLNYRMWDQLLVYSYTLGGRSYVATHAFNAESPSTRQTYDVTLECPRNIGPLSITAAHGPLVSFSNTNGTTTGTLNLWAGKWTFSV